MRKANAFAIISLLLFLLATLVYAEASVGIKSGDWIEYEFNVSGAPPPDMPQQVKAECVSVAGTIATLRMIMHMGDGTEHVETMVVDVASGLGNATFQVLIPANSKAGDTIKVVNYGDLTIAGETTGTYAGASRTIVYASLSQGDMHFNYRWDKQTGVLMEISLTQGAASAAYKATSTNLWQASSNPLALPSSLPVELLSISISLLVAVAMVIAALVYTRHKRG
ncbi:MAG: hypothetical protein QXM52_02830 [Candidatus Bathyarchaeia archaeon]